MSEDMIIDKLMEETEKLAVQWNKTKDPGIRDQWYKKVKEAAKYVPEEQEGYRINFKRRVDK
jgi:hypothetical protein